MEKKNKNALPFIQTRIVNELPFTQVPIKQEKNADNYKNCIPHPTKQKPIEVIDLTNVDGEEQPETFEKRTPILSDEKFVQEKQKQITKKTSAKIDAKSLNDARVAKRNEKKENLKRQLQQNTEKNECNQKTKTINFCRIVNFLCKNFFLENVFLEIISLMLVYCLD